MLPALVEEFVSGVFNREARSFRDRHALFLVVSTAGHTKVIVMTGRQIGAIRAAALEGGAFAFLTKPFDDETFLALVRQASERCMVPESSSVLERFILSLRPEKRRDDVSVLRASAPDRCHIRCLCRAE